MFDLDTYKSTLESFQKALGDYSYTFLFVLSVILLWMACKKFRKTLLLPMGVIALFIVCPVTANLMLKLQSSDGTGSYMRIVFCFISPIVIALAIAQLYRLDLKRQLRYFLVFASLSIVMFIGTPVFSNQYFAKSQNVYKVYDTTIDIADFIDANYPGQLVETDSTLGSEFRQYDANIWLHRGGRYTALQYYYDGAKSATEINDFLRSCELNGVKILVTKNDAGVMAAAGNLMWNQVYTSDDYVVYHIDRPEGWNGWLLKNYAEDSGNVGMFYSFYNVYTGKLVLIDGGDADNEAKVRSVIAYNGGVVSTWILTHYHADHLSAFNAIYANPGDITIENIYDPDSEAAELEAVAQWWDSIETYQTYIELTQNADNVTHLKRGDTLEIDDLSIKIYNAYDELTLETVNNGAGDLCNNLSLVFEVSAAEHSILFMGDCHSKEMGDFLMELYGDELKADYVNLAHHGNNSQPLSFYEFVDPQIALFDGPQWLFEGTYTAAALRDQLTELGVTTYDFCEEEIHGFYFY